jgi:hypothetical protein
VDGLSPSAPSHAGFFEINKRDHSRLVGTGSPNLCHHRHMWATVSVSHANSPLRPLAPSKARTVQASKPVRRNAIQRARTPGKCGLSVEPSSVGQACVPERRSARPPPASGDKRPGYNELSNRIGPCGFAPVFRIAGRATVASQRHVPWAGTQRACRQLQAFVQRRSWAHHSLVQRAHQLETSRS